MKDLLRAVKRKKVVVVCLAALIGLCALAGVTAHESGVVAVSGEITNWGLSFQQEGQAPIGNADSVFGSIQRSVSGVGREKSAVSHF